MADFKAALYSFLSTQVAITAVVGTRMYPVLAPASAGLPFVTYQRLDEQEEGWLLGRSGLSRATYQLDVWGATPAQAEAVVLALKSTLDRYRGLMGSVPVRQCTLVSILDGLEDPLEGQTQGLWRHTLTAEIWFHEP
jgi:hypothetical protein